jgi:molecular chaperone DnaK
LPASRSEAFRTVSDQQPTVEIEVYQGESEDLQQNHRIGRFTVEGLAPVPAGNQILVKFDLDLNGILRVSAREKATGLEKQITIENALADYEADGLDEARERLSAFWDDLRPGGQSGLGEEFEDEDEDDDIIDADQPVPLPELAPGPREGQRESVQARALLEKAERLKDKASPEDQEHLQQLVTRVRDALADRKWDDLTAASNELTDVLFYLDDA